jgi:hypothetical protein
MKNGRLGEQTGKWLFQLQQEHSLQFRITSQQGGSNHILLEGHDISVLLDYLYDHRELIYEATHDQEMLYKEAKAAEEDPTIDSSAKRQIKPTRYIDDGVRRTRATF